MNKQESDILKLIKKKPCVNQRILSEESGHSLGVVNRSIRNLLNEGYLDENIRLTEKSRNVIITNSPKNAIILAAGFGMRMVPINTQVPKALLEVNGETLIERLINQLHEVGVRKIYVVVGYMKEQFEYFIDEYGVELIVNEEYKERNNLHSLRLASSYLSNSYIVPCDIWCDKNPFDRQELYSWYLVNELMDEESTVRVNRKMELVTSKNGGNHMVGIAYLVEEQSKTIRERLESFDGDKAHDDSFWEETLVENDRMIVHAKVVHSSDVVEINTYEELRELDEESNHLKSDAIYIISDVFKVREKDITDIEVLKKGMTNRSFLFSVLGTKYIMRIPGEGTDNLVDRKGEAEVYDVIKGKGISDDVLYINPINGYKISKYLDGSRVCNPKNEEDLKKCMARLKAFHSLDLKVDHVFDIFGKIDFYESLWGGSKSIYRDYSQTKEKVLSLKAIIDSMEKEWCLTHIDAVPDNFLFVDLDGKEEIKLIDWEYAGMQDPHVDIAMFCIYSLYDRGEIDGLIDIYFEGKCSKEVRIKIYAYISVCGLLWSNWCEYKRNLGVEFGEYSLRQYRYAKDYYRVVKEELNNEGR